MKFSTREDVAAPIDHVFERLSDFDAIERAALRRGVEVARTDRMRTRGPGMTWTIRFDWREKRRRAVVELAEHVPTARLLFDATGQAFTGALAISLIPLSPRRTRMVIEFEFRPRTMAARLVVQSLRLTRGRQNRRFKEQVGGFARHIENGYDAPQAGRDQASRRGGA